MVKVIKSTILNAPIDAVWEVLRDFNGHDRWHPAVADSEIERGRASDIVGCIRKFHLKDGSLLREQLMSLSDIDAAYSYCLLDSPSVEASFILLLSLLPKLSTIYLMKQQHSFFRSWIIFIVCAKPGFVQSTL